MFFSSPGIFADDRYWDVYAEYAKASPNDVLCRFTVHNRSPETADIHVIPTLWFRNTWSWGCKHEVDCDKFWIRILLVHLH